jgi:hypothetical protein
MEKSPSALNTKIQTLPVLVRDEKLREIRSTVFLCSHPMLVIRLLPILQDSPAEAFRRYDAGTKNSETKRPLS